MALPLADAHEYKHKHKHELELKLEGKPGIPFSSGSFEFSLIVRFLPLLRLMLIR